MELLKEHDMLQGFRLGSTEGETVDLRTYRGRKNLVVLFFEPGCEECLRFLTDAAARYADFRDMEAEILAVGRGAAEHIAHALGDSHLPFSVLADPDGATLGRYSDSVPAIFVADRFGEIRLTSGGRDHALDQDKVLTMLHLIELECP